MLKLCKFRARFVTKIGMFLCSLGLALKTCILLCLYLIVDLNVKLYKLVNAAVLNGLFIAPKLISNDELTKLCSPVAKIVDTNAGVACKLVKKL
jgi:hypothetical protein